MTTTGRGGIRHPDCYCKQTVHCHGTRTTYVVHKCRCDDCRTANRTESRARVLRKVQAQYNPDLAPVPGDLVREHLHLLMDAGMGWKRIANNAKVASTTVATILYGRYPHTPDNPEHRPPAIKVGRDIAERLLAVQLVLAPAAVVDATGTVRRIRALIAVGWSCRRIAAALDREVQAVRRLRNGTPTTSVVTRDAVKQLYDQLWDADPCADVTQAVRHGAQLSRNYAADHGWAPPAMWDDDFLDAPDAPEPVTGPYCRAAGCLTAVFVKHLCRKHYDGQRRGYSDKRKVNPEDVQWLLDQGETLEAIAQRLHVQLAAVEQALIRSRAA